jgi:dTDP-4-dehydrorhamnose 3,5-epimerase
MYFSETSLSGVKRIFPTVFEDERGFFMETWHSRRFAENGIDVDFVQDNASRSAKGTLRGIHYQIEQAQGKLIRVVDGEIFDVAVDLRKSSSTYGKWVGELLSAENKQQLWIPPGFGHGFLVLSDVAEVNYKCTDYYAREHERSVRWDDPDIAIDWPLSDGATPILSAKDAEAPRLSNAETFE